VQCIFLLHFYFKHTLYKKSKVKYILSIITFNSRNDNLKWRTLIMVLHSSVDNRLYASPLLYYFQISHYVQVANPRPPCRYECGLTDTPLALHPYETLRVGTRTIISVLYTRSNQNMKQGRFGEIKTFLRGRSLKVHLDPPHLGSQWSTQHFTADRFWHICIRITRSIIRHTELLNHTILRNDWRISTYATEIPLLQIINTRYRQQALVKLPHSVAY
jgi:hypothetical protein